MLYRTLVYQFHTADGVHPFLMFEVVSSKHMNSWVLFLPKAHINQLLKFCGTPKIHFFCRSDQKNIILMHSHQVAIVALACGREKTIYIAPDCIMRYCMF